jgi:hypothetical protein
VSQALNLLRSAINAISAATVLAVSADMADRNGANIQTIMDEIQEMIRNNPRAGMRCSAALIAFRHAVQAALEYLSQPPGQIDKFALIRLIQTIQSTLATLLECLGVE